MQQDHCNMQPCNADQDCTLADWTAWVGCDASAPTQSSRYRRVLQPSSGSGNPCSGALKEVKACVAGNGKSCAIHDWLPWHDCSKTCGGGQAFRCRHVLSGGTHGKACPDSSLVATQPCGMSPCPSKFGGPSCEFSTWDEWSDCSQLCGHGIKRRHRKVLGPLSEHHGCVGPMREIKACIGTANNCGTKQDCVWEDWSAWGGCSRTCGSGQKRRMRQVLTMPRGDGALCHTAGDPGPHADNGDMTQVAECNPQNCHTGCINGAWTDWGAWSTCRADKCSSGYSMRHRMKLHSPMTVVCLVRV